MGVILADRRTQTTQHDILCTQRNDIESTLSEQRAYRSLSAQGEAGSETQFVDLASLKNDLMEVENRIAVLERHLEL